MGVQVTWYDIEQTVILYKFSGSWHWNEYFAANQEAHHLFNSVDHSICIIGDLSESISVPRSPLINASDAFFNDPCIVCSIFVGLNPFLRNLLTMIMSIYPGTMNGQDIHVVETMKDADALLANRSKLIQP